MKLAEDIWLGSVAARNNLIAAANYSAAFYGNAAVQSWSLGLTAPQVFWSAMARAFDDSPDNRDAAPSASPVAEAPVLSVVDPVQPETAPEPEVVEAVAAPAPEAVAEDVAEIPETDTPNPLLLDEARGGVADDLKLIKGIGAKLEAGLNEIGIFHFDQIAGLDEAGIDWLDEHLAGFKRSCARFDLVKGAGEFV
jgi:predicted flap endonuclease-1-like 5' DNA nuclease